MNKATIQFNFFARCWPSQSFLHTPSSAGPRNFENTLTVLTNVADQRELHYMETRVCWCHPQNRKARLNMQKIWHDLWHPPQRDDCVFQMIEPITHQCHRDQYNSCRRGIRKCDVKTEHCNFPRGVYPEQTWNYSDKPLCKYVTIHIKRHQRGRMKPMLKATVQL